jgi:hypothetical protein
LGASAGSEYSITYRELAGQYDPRGIPMSPDATHADLQLMHSKSVDGHQTGTVGCDAVPLQVPAKKEEGMSWTGKARAADEETPDESTENAKWVLEPAPPARARAMEGGVAVEVAKKVGELAIYMLPDNDGDITWELEQGRGFKHPNDIVPSPLPPAKDATTIRLDRWPAIDVGFLVTDRLSAWFKVDWQYNGKSLGNIRIANIGTNQAIGNKLKVTATIMDDNIVYDAAGIAALRVQFYYRFISKLPFVSDGIAFLDLHLFGDGTYEEAHRWEQEV